MTTYYNEHDPFAAEWLRNLIAAGHIAPGEVDERSIEDVRPSDLRGFVQCHFFAGIGVWSYALRQAGWPDEREVWTGSCPCQPFSAAGKRGGTDDERHLWPAFFHLIDECRPPVVLGEQVASKDGLAWLDLVQADMESAGYAFGPLDTCAAGFGAPHIRQRLWFVGLANHHHQGLEGRRQSECERAAERAVGPCGVVERLADEQSDGRLGRPNNGDGRRGQRASRLEGEVGGLADGNGRDPGTKGLQRSREQRQQQEDRGAVWLEHNPSDGRLEGRPKPSERGSELRCSESTDGAGPLNGFWRDADWLCCRDGKWRPVEPGTFPLAHGAASRVGRLRAYGNAIVARQAQVFVESVIDTIDEFAIRQELLAA